MTMGMKEAESKVAELRKLYWALKKELKKNGAVSIQQHLAEDNWLVNLYNANVALRIDNQLIDNSLRTETETPQVILYLLCLISKMPEIPVKLEVQLSYTGDFNDVYKTLLESHRSGIHNPFIITAFYAALQNAE